MNQYSGSPQGHSGRPWASQSRAGSSFSSEEALYLLECVSGAPGRVEGIVTKEPEGAFLLREKVSTTEYSGGGPGACNLLSGAVDKNVTRGAGFPVC